MPAKKAPAPAKTKAPTAKKTAKEKAPAPPTPAAANAVRAATGVAGTLDQLEGEFVEIVADAAAALRHVAFRQLVASRANPRKRFDLDEIEALAASIARDGLLQNLVVRPAFEKGEYEILAGERRWRAIGNLVEEGKWDPAAATVPVRVVEAGEGDALALALAENAARQDLTPLEEAHAFRALRQVDPAAWTTAAIAAAIGRTPRHVQLRLALLDRLDEAVQQALADGKITLAQARALTLAPRPVQGDMLKQVLRGDYAMRTADDIAAAATRRLVPAKHAIFPLDAYTGETVEDPETGETWFADRDRFIDLQEAAIRARIAALRRTAAFVDRVSWFNKHDYVKAPAGEPAGVVVEVRGGGEVVEHPGLAKKQFALTPPDGDEDDDAGDSGDIGLDGGAAFAEARAREDAHQREEVEAFRAALAARVRALPMQDLARLALMAAARGYTCGLSLAEDSDDVLGYVGFETDETVDEDTEEDALWQHLAALAPAPLREAFSRVVADGIEINTWTRELTPLWRHLAGEWGIALPARFRAAEKTEAA